MSIFHKEIKKKEIKTIEHFIESTEVDKFLELKMSTLFSLMQECATQQLEDFDMGKATTVDVGIYWVITRYSVDIVRMPRYLETVRISTYFKKASKFMFQRNFVILDAKGQTIIRASSTWCVLNKSNHSINFDPFPGKEVPTYSLDGELPSPEKVGDTESQVIDSRKVRYTDLDLHGHVSNTKYIDYIVDSHDGDFYDKHRISRFEINYEKEFMSNDSFEVLSNSASPETIYIKVSDKTITKTKLTYSNR